MTAFWSGTVASLVLVANPTLNFVVYEFLKRKIFEIAKYSRVCACAWEHACSGTQTSGKRMRVCVGLARGTAFLCKRSALLIETVCYCDNDRIVDNDAAIFIMGVSAVCRPTRWMACVRFSQDIHLP